jgi:REP element-mobilizing transposase RayT
MAMPERPLALFITFTTYGAWLHGKAPGSVDCAHNEFDAPFLPANPVEEAERRQAMTQPPYHLDQPRRAIVLAAIQEVCRHRGWQLLACHVRTTHVHAIVAGAATPEKMMTDFKAYASRRLTEAGFENRDRKRWTRHGSTKYIWDDAYLSRALHYVLHGQGAPMERCAHDPACLESEPESEPRA